MMDRIFCIGDRVKHFKHEGYPEDSKQYTYEIVAFAHHSETGENLVVYKSLYNDDVCARPTEMFMSEVDHEKYPLVTQKYRFEKM